MCNGTAWQISAGNEQCFILVRSLAQAMQLQAAPSGERDLSLIIYNQATPKSEKNLVAPAGFQMSTPSRPSHGNLEKLLTFCSPWFRVSVSEKDRIFRCFTGVIHNKDILALQMMQIAGIVALHSQFSGGLLVHGALVEHKGAGIILAGTGGSGKTTASKRLPSGWSSLSDDMTLVLQTHPGKFSAHPWPTWSRFMFGGEGDSWCVRHSVPLKYVFFLKQDQSDRTDPIGPGQAAAFLNKTAEELWWHLPHLMATNSVRALRLLRFENICTLVKKIPFFRLCLTKNGKFWEDIERTVCSF